MSDPEATTEVLRVEPSDVVVLSYDGHIDPETAHKAAKVTQEAFPANKVLCVQGGMTLSATRDVVLVKVGDALLERIGDDWSPSLQCRIHKADDGMYEMWSRIDYRAENALKEIRDLPLEEGAYQMREIASRVLEEIERPLVEVPA